MCDVLNLDGAVTGAILHSPGLERIVTGNASDDHSQLLDPSKYVSGGEKGEAG